jgi:hypothetical protein
MSARSADPADPQDRMLDVRGYSLFVIRCSLFGFLSLLTINH